MDKYDVYMYTTAHDLTMLRDRVDTDCGLNGMMWSIYCGVCHAALCIAVVPNMQRPFDAFCMALRPQQSVRRVGILICNAVIAVISTHFM